MYEVVFDPRAVDFLEKAEKVTAKRIWDKIMSTKSNPHRYFERLTGRTDYRLRIGDHRVIADILEQEKRIQITLIDHRKKIYR